MKNFLLLISGLLVSVVATANQSKSNETTCNGTAVYTNVALNQSIPAQLSVKLDKVTRKITLTLADMPITGDYSLSGEFHGTTADSQFIGTLKDTSGSNKELIAEIYDLADHKKFKLYAPVLRCE
ncbi:MAG: hypothetical protein ACXWRE_16435 [Pseudobdellovibrionaceae bacterium]